MRFGFSAYTTDKDDRKRSKIEEEKQRVFSYAAGYSFFLGKIKVKKRKAAP